jgi:hypothetical protein
MPTTKKLDRRTLLSGILQGTSVSVALPALEAMLDCNGTAYAQGGARVPKRFGTWYFGGGLMDASAYPTTSGPNWTPSPTLEPLSKVKDRVTVVSGTDLKANGKAHNSHRAFSLAASWHRESNGYGNPTEPSIDQIAAQAWAGQTKLDSLQVGVSTKGFYQMSWKSGYKVMPAESKARTVFDRLFGNGLPAGAGAGAPSTPVIESHKSILDATLNGAKRLSARLGSADRERIDAHFNAIRDIEKRLAAAKAGPAGDGCTAPRLTEGGPPPQGEDLVGGNRAMADLLTTALACDIVRAFSFQFTRAQCHTVFWPVGATSEHHPMTHGGQPGYSTYQPRINVFTMQQLAYFLERLAATPEGSGSVLDNTLVYVTSEFLRAPGHSNDNHPVLLAGRAGGAIRAGHHVVAKGDTMAKIMVAALLAVGVNVPRVGDPGAPYSATEPLSGLLT